MTSTAPLGIDDRVDLAALTRWLRAHIPAFAHVDEARLRVARFPAGHSNLTYDVRVDDDDGSRCVLRAAPPGAAHIAAGHDMMREAKVLASVHAATSLAPAVLAVQASAADSPLQTPFFAMAHVEGLILRRTSTWPSAETMRGLSQCFVDTLADLHALNLSMHDLASLGKPVGYLARQVEGWRKRYEAARIHEVPAMTSLSAYVQAHVPQRLPVDERARATLVHNDFKLDNLVVDPSEPTRIIAVLDWEMATIGDPALDVATVLAYWIEADDDDALRALPFCCTTLPGCFTRAQVLERYEARSGRRIDAPVFYYAFALFKLATILQQLYFRAAQGFVHDERFARLRDAASVLATRALRAIDADSL